MISIRDADKQKLIDARGSLQQIGPETFYVWQAIGEVIQSIEDLSQQAPVLDPVIVPMTEADKRICYPERYK